MTVGKIDLHKRTEDGGVRREWPYSEGHLPVGVLVKFDHFCESFIDDGWEQEEDDGGSEGGGGGGGLVVKARG